MKFIGIAVSIVALSSPASSFTMKSEALQEFRNREIQVIASDSATGGCWTNVESSRRSLENKLKSLGMKVVDSSKNRILISVTAQRLRPTPRLVLRNTNRPANQPRGKCFGNIELLAYEIENESAPDALTIYGMHESTYSGYDRANELATEFIQKVNFLFD